MNQSEFNILVTNVMGIADQVLSKHCGNFLDEIAEEEGSEEEKAEIAAALEGLTEFKAETNYQDVIDRGYASLATLSGDFDKAWQNNNADTLSPLLSNIPQELPNLRGKLSGQEFELWIEHASALPEGNYFSQLHQYCLSLFNSSAHGDNEVIRLAIADDDVSLLEKEADNIDSTQIHFEDINTALMIESVKTFEWLATRTKFTDQQVQTMLEYVSSDSAYFETVYKILSPTKSQHEAILMKVEEFNEEDTLSFLQNCVEPNE